LTSALNVRAAISYAHGRYDTEILALANRLNQEGIDCELDLMLAQADTGDRNDEVTGAIRLIASLATLDGATVLQPDLAVDRFGAKINSDCRIGNVYAGDERFLMRGYRKMFDYSQYGTRHHSALRYCREDPRAIAIIISQDGSVRLATTASRSLVVWDNVRLRSYLDDLIEYRKFRRRVANRRRQGQSIGYTDVPRTLAELQRSVRSQSK
jgi:hypothetical protein